MSGHRRFKTSKQCNRVVRHCEKSPLVHRNGFELLADAVAEAIRSRRGCRKWFGGRFARSQARFGQFLWALGFHWISGARLAASAASSTRSASIRRPAPSIAPISRDFTAEAAIIHIALALSVKLSVKASANSKNSGGLTE